MTVPTKLVNIAVIGDEDLVSSLRLAGISNYRLISANKDTEVAVQQALAELIEETEVGIVVLQEDFAPHVSEMVARVKQSKQMTPIIIEVPSRYKLEHGDVAKYYRLFIRQFIGFDIGI